MIKRLLFIGIVVLTLSSVSFGQWYVDWGYGGVTSSSGLAFAGQGAWGVAVPLGPQEQIVIGTMGQGVVTGPMPGTASAAHGGYITSSQTAGPMTQSSTVAGFQTGYVSGPGVAVVQSNATVVTWQIQQ